MLTLFQQPRNGFKVQQKQQLGLQFKAQSSGHPASVSTGYNDCFSSHFHSFWTDRTDTGCSHEASDQHRFNGISHDSCVATAHLSASSNHNWVTQTTPSSLLQFPIGLHLHNNDGSVQFNSNPFYLYSPIL